MHSIHHIIDTLVMTPKRAVLATIIHVEGSAYRKKGATMLFLENAPPIGTLSAGCLETDLEIQANQLLQSDQMSCSMTYDMRAEDDLSWGRGAGCNGSVHILLEKVDHNLRTMFQQIQASLAERIRVKRLTYMYDQATKVESIWMPEHHHSKKRQQRFITEQHMETGMIDNNPQLFIQTFHPKRRLYIFGAGPDVIPLATIAAQVDFSVYVWDFRPAYQRKENYPHATLLTSVDVKQMIRHLSLGRGDSVIIMTHDFQKDREILSYFLEEPNVDYLGILGPRKRTKRLLKDTSIPTFLQSPVGMDIGAEGPTEIAISIIADVIQASHSIMNNEAVMKEKKRTSSS